MPPNNLVLKLWKNNLKGKNSKDNADNLENKIKNINLDFAYLKKIDTKIIILDHSFLLGNMKLFLE